MIIHYKGAENAAAVCALNVQNQIFCALIPIWILPQPPMFDAMPTSDPVCNPFHVEWHCDNGCWQNFRIPLVTRLDISERCWRVDYGSVPSESHSTFPVKFLTVSPRLAFMFWIKELILRVKLANFAAPSLNDGRFGSVNVKRMFSFIYEYGKWWAAGLFSNSRTMETPGGLPP